MKQVSLLFDQPTYITRLFLLQVHMKGNVGNRDVIFRRDMSTDTAIIIMTQPRCRGIMGNLRIDSDTIGENVIVYPD